MSTGDVVPAKVARRLLLDGQGLLADPARAATPARVYAQIERMGFVQVDTINVVERAHHLILYSRFDAYRPATLARLLERDRKLFEHWTHDAAVIPTAWFGHWRLRFAWWEERYRVRYKKRWQGMEPVVKHVRGRIKKEGALESADFEHKRERAGAGWWDWKPQKQALEFLWRTGQLAVTRRVQFRKVYDLVERVLPEAVRATRPGAAESVEWACRGGLERLGVATPRELRDYLDLIDLGAVRKWCSEAAKMGEIVEVMVEAEDGSPPRAAYALPDWKRRAGRLTAPPRRMRLLSPFDPVLRDRPRTQRLFNFDYRFEGFVEPHKRQYGYYVLALLEGDRLVGRLDPKLHRDRGLLEVKALHWEPGIKPTPTRKRALNSALTRLATQLGANDWTIP